MLKPFCLSSHPMRSAGCILCRDTLTELPAPLCGAVMDRDPWGFHIYCIFKLGNAKRISESSYAVPSMRWSALWGNNLHHVPEEAMLMRVQAALHLLFYFWTLANIPSATLISSRDAHVCVCILQPLTDHEARMIQRLRTGPLAGEATVIADLDAMLCTRTRAELEALLDLPNVGTFAELVTRALPAL